MGIREYTWKLREKNPKSSIQPPLWPVSCGMKRKTVLIMGAWGFGLLELGVGGTGQPAGTVMAAMFLSPMATWSIGGGTSLMFASSPVTGVRLLTRTPIWRGCKPRWAGGKRL